MKRTLWVISLILVTAMMVSVFAGCGSKPATETQATTTQAQEQPKPTEPPKVEKAKLRAVTYFTGEDPWKVAWQGAIKSFTDANPNIEVVDEATPSANDTIRTKIKTDFASGNEPDVCFFFTGSDTKPLVDSGKLFAWDEELAKDTTWSGNFAKAALDAVKYEGKVYALPTIGYYEGMFVNKDLFDANSVKVPTNYDELLAAVAAFKAKNIVPIAGSIDESYYLIEKFILSAGGPQGHNTPFDPSWATGLNVIKDLYSKGAFPKDALTLKDEQAQTLFKDKKAAMMINGSWCAGGLKDKDNTIIIPVPLVKDAKANPTDIIGGFGSGWYMSKGLNEQKNGAAMKFIKYITSPAVEATFMAVGGVPGIKCDVPNSTPVAKSGFDMMNQANSVSSPIDAQIIPESFTAIRKGLAYVVTGKKTAEDLLKEAEKLNVKK